MTIGRLRHYLYRGGSILGDVEAVQKSERQRSARPVVHRVVRKVVYREEGQVTRRVFRAFGL
jgi:hypothetical protein